MAYPALFRHLFGDNPVRPFKFRKELIPLDVDAVETFRKSLIGCLIPTTMATLPSCLGIPDGSLFLFEDYPELKEKYDAGGFNGMLLESTASSEEKDAWRGKWIKHSQGLGLYAPRLQGLFLRNGKRDETMGQHNEAGIPEIVAAANVLIGYENRRFTGSFYESWNNMNGMLGAGSTMGGVSFEFKASLSSPRYGSSDTVMPESADIAIGLYLGRMT